MINSIRNKFLAIYVLLFTIAIIFLTSISVSIINNNLVGVISMYSLNATRQYADNIGDELEYHHAALEVLAENNAIKNEKIDQIIDKLAVLLSSDKYLFENIIFADLEGISYRIDGSKGNVTDRAYFNEIIHGNKASHVGEPILGRVVKVPTINVSVSVRNKSDKLVGIVMGSIPLETLSSEINQIELSEESFGWIIDKNGTIIAHPDFDFSNYVDIETLPNYGYEYNETLLKQLKNESEGIGEYYHEVDNERRLVTFVNIPNSPGWKFGISSNKTDLLSLPQFMRTRIISLSAIVLLIVIIVTLVMTNSIVKPIQGITQAASGGDEFVISLSLLQKNREIITLIDAYNHMRNALWKHSNELEDLVIDRTKELKSTNAELYRLATRDALTGVYNRSRLYDELIRFKTSVDHGEISNFAILFIDVNNFKYMNDTFGHDVGDQVLKTLIKHIQENLESTMKIGRYGGDEFIIIMPSVTKKESHDMIAVLIDTIAALRNMEEMIIGMLGVEAIDIPSNRALGLSVGYAGYNKEDEIDIDQLIKVADKSMYEMKVQGKED